MPLGWTQARSATIEFAALVHDVGKIHIPKEIINKPGPLNDEEWTLMHQHTTDGERMLKQAVACSPMSERSSVQATSGGTEAATRTGSPARRSP